MSQVLETMHQQTMIQRSHALYEVYTASWYLCGGTNTPPVPATDQFTLSKWQARGGHNSDFRHVNAVIQGGDVSNIAEVYRIVVFHFQPKR